MKQSERGQERDDRHRAYIVSLSGVVFINFELRKERSVWSYEYFRKPQGSNGFLFCDGFLLHIL